MSVDTLAGVMDTITRTIIERGIIEARDDKSFWDKYKWYIIGGLGAMPIQIGLGYWYWRRRKAKKAAALKRTEEEQGMGTYSNMGGQR
ncbi:hypothetical protein PZA11_001863 [Diplocarpon coronariae]|uniref:Uncharacterized protein n=1 Tax=Diplocarpon coronariae TaxID=2795749 RepID=A0A218Z0J5_9HELO|nr:hypothetical protein JHW43_008959 [Diplocarpon mali]OWP01569.1 hypothetical protein B2J93_4673 [Marssonina coronariae]